MKFQRLHGYLITAFHKPGYFHGERSTGVAFTIRSHAATSRSRVAGSGIYGPFQLGNRPDADTGRAPCIDDCANFDSAGTISFIRTIDISHRNALANRALTPMWRICWFRNQLLTLA